MHQRQVNPRQWFRLMNARLALDAVARICWNRAFAKLPPLER